MVLPGIISDFLVYSTLTALMSVGLTITYLTTKVPNFAQGNFVTIGVYTSFLLYRSLKISPYPAALLAFVLAGLVGVAIYVIVIRPLAHVGLSPVFLAIATFAVGIIFTGIFGIFTDYEILHGVQDADSFIMSGTDFTIFDNKGVVFVAPIVLAATSVFLFLFLTRTKFGLALRAAVEDESLAQIFGIKVDRTHVISWFLSGGLSGAAGALIVLWVPGSTSIGASFLLIIFAASVLGGLSSIPGSIVGGILVGGLPIVVTLELSNVVGFWIIGYQVAVPLLIMAGTLLIAPEGLPSAWRKLASRRR